MRLETPNLVLMPCQFTDVNDFHQAVRESLAELHPWYVWAEDPFTLRHAQTQVQTAVSQQRDGKGHFMIARSKSGRLVGEVRLTEQTDPAGRQVPMFLLESWIRQGGENPVGLHAEALKAAAEYAARELKARRVEVRVCTAQSDYCQALDAAGFQREGVLKNTWKLNEQTLGDTAVYSRLA